MKEKIEEFKKEKIAINTQTQEEYNALMKIFDNFNIRWRTRERTTAFAVYKLYSNKTCLKYDNVGICYANIDCYKEKGCKIISYQDFIKPKQFTKSDLKDNHIVVLDNGNKFIWKLIHNKNYFGNNLKSEAYGICDITEVWEFDKLVFKREEPKVKIKEEPKKEILDKEEKKYLKRVIKPKRIYSKVKYIIKCFDGYNYYIDIELGDDDIFLPCFRKNNMYLGMKIDEEYTLKDLGLEKEEK